MFEGAKIMTDPKEIARGIAKIIIACALLSGCYYRPILIYQGSPTNEGGKNER